MKNINTGLNIIKLTGDTFGLQVNGSVNFTDAITGNTLTLKESGAGVSTLILGTSTGPVFRSGILFNENQTNPSKIYDRYDGTHSQGLTFQSRNDAFEFIGSGGTAADANIIASNLSAVRLIKGDVVRPLIIQGGVSFNDVNDGIRMETVNGSNVFEQRFQIEAGSSTPDAYFTNIGSVGIGTATPNASSIVDITSTTQGFLPPRMTGTQAEAISTPAEGLMVYSTDGSGVTIVAKGWWGYDGTNWIQF